MLPVVAILFLILIILAILVAIFGTQESFYKSNFVLPFDTNDYTITSPYGKRIDPISKESKMHYGIDVVPVSNNLVAIADGLVIASAYFPESNGEYIIIEHNISGTVYRSSYSHMQENSRTVVVGEQVKQGQQIGIMGTTGYSTGTHLHFELKKYNAEKGIFENIDPTPIIEHSIVSSNINLYDYSNNKFNNPFNKDNLYNDFEIIKP